MSVGGLYRLAAFLTTADSNGGFSHPFRNLDEDSLMFIKD
jgi:hypothetical protein